MSDTNRMAEQLADVLIELRHIEASAIVCRRAADKLDDSLEAVLRVHVADALDDQIERLEELLADLEPKAAAA